MSDLFDHLVMVLIDTIRKLFDENLYLHKEYKCFENY